MFNRVSRNQALFFIKLVCSGGMVERLNAAVLKTVDRLFGPWVRIPLPPPFMFVRVYGT